LGEGDDAGSWSVDSTREDDALVIWEHVVDDIVLVIINLEELVVSEFTNFNVSENSNLIISSVGLGVGVSTVISDQVWGWGTSRALLLGDKKTDSIQDSETIFLFNDFSVGDLSLFVVPSGNVEGTWVGWGTLVTDTGNVQEGSVFVMSNIVANNINSIKGELLIVSESLSFTSHDLDDDVLVIVAEDEGVLVNLLDPVKSLEVVLLEVLVEIRLSLVIGNRVVTFDQQWVCDIIKIEILIEVLVEEISLEKRVFLHRRLRSDFGHGTCDEQGYQDGMNQFHLLIYILLTLGYL
jgi:hypothetical protein